MPYVAAEAATHKNARGCRKDSSGLPAEDQVEQQRVQ
jgi:hypothetical protein